MLPNLLFIIFVFLSKSLSFNQIGVWLDFYAWLLASVLPWSEQYQDSGSRSSIIYSFSTKVLQVLVQCQCLLWNQFFVFRQPKIWLLTRKTLCWSMNKEVNVSGAGLLWPRTDKKHLWPSFLKTRAREACPHLYTQQPILFIFSNWSNSGPMDWMPVQTCKARSNTHKESVSSYLFQVSLLFLTILGNWRYIPWRNDVTQLWLSCLWKSKLVLKGFIGWTNSQQARAPAQMEHLVWLVQKEVTKGT